MAGFDFGRFASDEELKFIRSQRALQKPSYLKMNPKTELYKQEADIALAARSFHSAVLTLDAKKGPVADAHTQGGKVVFLTGFDPSAMSLGDYVKQALSERGGFDRLSEASNAHRPSVTTVKGAAEKLTGEQPERGLEARPRFAGLGAPRPVALTQHSLILLDGLPERV